MTTDAGTIPLYYHMDHMGSSEFLTSDVTQKVTSWISYDEWAIFELGTKGLYGKQIRTRDEFFIAIEKAFRFPAGCENSINIFLDWITDLWWISENSINLVIYNQRYFLNEDSELKKKLMKYFEEDILPFGNMMC